MFGFNPTGWIFLGYRSAILRNALRSTLFHRFACLSEEPVGTLTFEGWAWLWPSSFGRVGCSLWISESKHVQRDPPFCIGDQQTLQIIILAILLRTILFVSRKAFQLLNRERDVHRRLLVIHIWDLIFVIYPFPSAQQGTSAENHTFNLSLFSNSSNFGAALSREPIVFR